MNQRYSCSEDEISHYTCNRTKDKVLIDGNLEKDYWQKAEKSPQFVDSDGPLINMVSMTSTSRKASPSSIFRFNFFLN